MLDVSGLVTASLPFEVEWKTADGTGELDGYMSVFGNVDQGGDVVMPGAFRKTFSDWSRRARRCRDRRSPAVYRRCDRIGHTDGRRSARGEDPGPVPSIAKAQDIRSG